MEFSLSCSELMPEGKPNFLSVVKFPMIKNLLHQNGKKIMLALIVTLVKNFCDSMNVVRNMNEQQMLEAAIMLLDECDNFRLEDYVMMFQMAKKGELVKIYDRIDLQVITAILDEYWIRRHDAAEKEIVEQEKHLSTIGNPERSNAPQMIWDEEKGYIPTKTMPQQLGSFINAIDGMKEVVTKVIGDREQRELLKNIQKEDTEKIRKQLKERGYDTE